MRILPSVVTTHKNYFSQLKEAEKLGLKEICVFLTCLNKDEREDFYNRLRSSSLEKIPLVHLKSDISLDEIKFFSDKFKTNLFNIHPLSLYPLENDLSAFKKRIYIENSDAIYEEKEIKNFAGICIDFTHLEADRLLGNDIYKKNIEVVKKYYCGCGHISAIRKKLAKSPKTGDYQYDFHYLNNLSEVDYLERYFQFLPKVSALELENSIKEQLIIIDYLSSKTWASKV